jgi:hypothetical protein
MLIVTASPGTTLTSRVPTISVSAPFGRAEHVTCDVPILPVASTSASQSVIRRSKSENGGITLSPLRWTTESVKTSGISFLVNWLSSEVVNCVSFRVNMSVAFRGRGCCGSSDTGPIWNIIPTGPKQRNILTILSISLFSL